MKENREIKNRRGLNERSENKRVQSKTYINGKSSNVRSVDDSI